MYERRIVIGTRGSALALWQSEHVAGLLRQAWPGLAVELQVLSTRGDQQLDHPLVALGGKGLFTEALEAALLDGRIHVAVHSLKDLPIRPADELAVAAIPSRADPSDVLISRGGHTLDTLPAGAVVGTSSPRRAAQLLAVRPDLAIRPVRGNVDTRIARALDPAGPIDAIVLARAGLERLGRLATASQILPLELMLPAPGQAALAVQVRAERAAIDLVAPLHHPPSGAAVTTERAFLARLEGGCALPVAALATVQGAWLRLRGRVLAADGSAQIDLSSDGPLDEAEALGHALAEEALACGASSLMQARP